MTHTRPFARRLAVPGVVAALAIAGAACSSSGGGLPAAGNDSPEAAVSGFIQALENGNVPTACSYVAPNQQSVCHTAFDGGVSLKASGLKFGNTFTNGDQALVSIEASSFCVGAGAAPTTTVCFSNSDPNKGLPTSDADFQAALNAAFNNPTSPLTATVQVNGSWYVESAAGGGGGTTGTTGSTTTSTTGTTGSTTTSTTGTTGSTTTSTTGSSTSST